MYDKEDKIPVRVFKKSLARLTLNGSIGGGYSRKVRD